MARKKHQRTPAPGNVLYVPSTPAQQLEHARALHARAGHDPAERAQYLAEAAEYYAAAGADEQAEQAFRDAIADGGHVAGSVHGFYAEFLFARARQAEALESIEQARKLRPSDPDVFMVIGETLDEHGHHAQAAKWLTIGLVRYLGDLAEITAQDLELDEDASVLVSARRRARGHAGLPKDHLDELAEQEYGSDFYDNEEP
jgi:tetratricopeptide (TPR) repeat protein